MGGVSRDAWLRTMSPLSSDESVLQDRHQTKTTKGRLDHVEVAQNIRGLHLHPAMLVQYSNPDDSLGCAATILDMEKDATKLWQLNKDFENPSGMLAALQGSREEDRYGWGLTVSGIRSAWDDLGKFASKNPEQGKSLTNLYNVFNAIRDRLTTTNSCIGNPLVRAANTLESLMTKMAAAGLTDRNGKQVTAPEWQAS